MSDKLFDILESQTVGPSPARLAARKWIDIALNIRSAMNDGVAAIAIDANQLGMTAVFAQMEQAAIDRGYAPDAAALLAAQFAAVLPLLQPLWEASSSKPFPTLPMDPPVNTDAPVTDGGGSQ